MSSSSARRNAQPSGWPVLESPAARKNRRKPRRASSSGAVLVWPHGQREHISAAQPDTTGALALAGPHQQSAFGSVLIIGNGDELADTLRAAFAGETRCAIQTASDGTRISRLAEERAPDVILLNLPESEEEATALYQRLREHPRTRHAHAVLLSTATSRELLRMGIEDGLLLRKPFQPERLLGLVRALLPRR